MNKSSSKDPAFILGLIAVAAIIAIAAYFLLISPALMAMTEAAQRKEDAAAFNTTLEIQLAQYEAEFAKLPEIEAEIDEIHDAFSQREDLAAVRRAIYPILAGESLRLTEENVALPVLVTPGGLSLAAAASAVGRESYIEALTFQDLYATEYEIAFSGQYVNLMRALAKIQMHEGRYFLIGGFEAKADEELNDGTFDVRLTIMVFTLADAGGAIDPGVPGENIDPDTGEIIDPPNLRGNVFGGGVVVSETPTADPDDEDDEEGAER